MEERALIESAKVVDSLWRTFDAFQEANLPKDGQDGDAKDTKLLGIDVLYHQPSGLYSEGNWHNCLVGISLVKLYEKTRDEKYKREYNKLAFSLFDLNFDEKTNSMRQRTHTPYPSWSHETGNVHHDRYLQPSPEKKLAGQAMAIIFWSYLRDNPAFVEQYNKLSDSFVSNFWSSDTIKWISYINSTDYFRALDHALAILAL